MATKLRSVAAAASLLAIAASGGVAVAQSSTQTYADITAGVGYSTNPILRFDQDKSSAFGRLSAFLMHSWIGERGRTSLSGYVENNSYLREYGSRQIFSTNADTLYRLNETTNLFGSLGFSGDLSGQLSNRFTGVPNAPEVPDPTIPPTTVVDPDLFSFAGRQYRLSGQAGVSTKVSERSDVTFSGGAERVWFTNDFVDDYTTLFASGGYNRRFTERTTGGVRLNLNRTEYDGSQARSTIINPELTIRTQLSPSIDATGAVGVTFARQRNDVGDSNSSTNLSLSGALCRNSETERLCGRVNRYATNSAAGSLVTNSSLGVDWFKRLDRVQTVQLSASAVRYSTTVPTLGKNKSTFYRAAATYDRKLNDRLSMGADLSYRSLALEGPDPDSDISGSVFVRYRLGDL